MTEKKRARKKNAEKKEFNPPLGQVGGARPRYGGRAGARARARALSRKPKSKGSFECSKILKVTSLSILGKVFQF